MAGEILDNQSSNGTHSAYDLALTAAYIAGPVVLAYFAAPYLAVAARAMFPLAYRAIIGAPSATGYFLTYIPAREKICSMVYNHAPLIVGAASTVIQTTKQTVSSYFNFFSSTSTVPTNDEEANQQEDNATATLAG